VGGGFNIRRSEYSKPLEAADIDSQGG